MFSIYTPLAQTTRAIPKLSAPKERGLDTSGAEAPLASGQRCTLYISVFLRVFSVWHDPDHQELA